MWVQREIFLFSILFILFIFFFLLSVVVVGCCTIRYFIVVGILVTFRQLQFMSPDVVRHS
jgi:hypothetical protein